MKQQQIDLITKQWHEMSDHAKDGAPLGGFLCNCAVVAPRILAILDPLTDDIIREVNEENARLMEAARVLTNNALKAFDEGTALRRELSAVSRDRDWYRDHRFWRGKRPE